MVFFARVRRRLQRAELGEWNLLLLEYVAERDEVKLSSQRRPHGRSATARPTADRQEAYDRVVECVLGDAVGRAKHALMETPRPARDHATADAMEELDCIPPPTGRWRR